MNNDSNIGSGDNGIDEAQSLRRRVISSMAWVGGLKYFGQIITWAVTIFVIRILAPSDYGLMAKAGVFIGFMLMISELGLEASIIQKKDITDEQLVHVFGLAICSNVLLFLVLFFSAPAIASFYSDERLVSILRALSSVFLLLPMYILPRGLLIRDMNFKLKSIVDLVGALLAAGCTLTLAILGFGVWALVLGNIAIHTVYAIGYNFIRRRFTLPKFGLKGYTHFLTFGGFVTGSRILWYFYSRSDIFIGGKFLSNKLLGIYSVAIQLASIPTEKLMPVLNQVAFPAYSHIQSNIVLARSHFQKSVRLVSLIVFPLYGGLLIVAPQLVHVILGSKWSEIIIPLTILCIIMPFRALSTLFTPALEGLGRPDVAFFNVGIAAVVMPAGFLMGVRWGILGVCWIWVIGFILVFIITSMRSLSVLGISFIAFSRSFGISLICSIGMILGITTFKYLLGGFIADALELACCIVLGAMLYLLLMLLLKRDYLLEAVHIIKHRD